MSQEDLITLTPAQAKELGKKGGQVKSEAKRYAQLKLQSNKALCKNCRAMCVLKASNLEKAKNHKCIIPEARAHAIWFNMPIMDINVLERADRQTLFKLIKGCKSNKDLKMLHDAIMNKKKIDHPQAQKIEIDHRQVVMTYQEMKEVFDKYDDKP